MRFPALKNLIFMTPVAVLAQTGDLKMNVVYQCPAVQATMQVFSCTGTGPGDTCDVQTAPQGRPPMRGKSTRPQVMALFTLCQLPAGARSGTAAPAQAQAGGFKVGDKVRVLASGWQEATILQNVPAKSSPYAIHRRCHDIRRV
jgi:hypothetical protein